MLNDRQLLERAARAAGYQVRWHSAWQCFVHMVPINTDNPPTYAGLRHVWEPLFDAGDAQRLAIRLRLSVRLFPSGVCVDSIYNPGNGTLLTSEEYGDDPDATVRRCIVRAAAEILNDETPEGRCSCPSGDGSLRWPCPQHGVSAMPAERFANQRTRFEGVIRRGGHGSIARHAHGRYMSAEVHSLWLGWCARGLDDQARLNNQHRETAPRSARS